MENMNFVEQVKVEQQRNPEVMQISLQQTSRAQLPLL